MIPQRATAADNLRGAALMVLAMAGFALEDLLIKIVSARVPVSQILATIGAGGALVFALIAWRQGRSLFERTIFVPVVLVRLGAEIFGTIGVVMSLALVPLSTASAILQTVPLAVTVGAALILGEQVGWRRWTAIAVGFGGALIILRPAGDAFDPNALWAVLGVVCLGLRDVVTRRVPKGITSVQLSAWAFAMLVPAGLLVLPFGRAPVAPGLVDWALLGGSVALGVGAYYAVTVATRIGEASAVAPFRYSRIIFALILAALVLGERPDLWTLVGAAVVVASGLYAFARERRRALSSGRAAG